MSIVCTADVYIPLRFVWPFVAGALLWWGRRGRQPGAAEADERALSIDEMWECGDLAMGEVLQPSLHHGLDRYLDDNRALVKAMRTDAVLIRERYTHDAAKQVEIA